MQEKFRGEVAALVSKALAMEEFTASKVEALLEVPEQDFGDYAFPCFALVRVLRKPPQQIAVDLAAKIRPSGNVEKVQASGAYLNFFVDCKKLADSVISDVLKRKGDYGCSKAGSGKRVVVEYPSPNTNKPLHLGHARNMLLGQSVSRILAFSGFRVFQVNLNNDRGVHICKAMLAYKLFGKGAKPDKKPDHFVGDFYVRYTMEAEKDPALDGQVQEMLRLWENGDKSAIALWRKINGWALKGFSETYEAFGIVHDKVYNESEHYRGGRDIVIGAYRNGLLKKDEKGNILIELKSHGLPDKILLRSDGTSVYMTQDINLALLKYRDFKMDKSVYVVGSEQALHFRQLFKILEVLGIYSGDMFHLAHGMVYLPEGRMKSREGKVVDADDLVEEMVETAAVGIRKRHKGIGKSELDLRARQIGMAALKFFILKYDPLRDFVFNPEDSISFEGETGPYVQYTHARICSIFEKHGKRLPATADFSLLKEREEQLLVRLLSHFPETVASASKNYKPLIIARYLLDLSQAFNNFYHSRQILKADVKTRNARLLLAAAVRQALRNGLSLLSIDAPERM